MLQRTHVLAQVFHALERHRTHRAVFQRNCIAGVLIVGDAVQAESLPRELETRHVIRPVGVRHHRLERARAHRVQRMERIAGAEQRFTLAHLAPGLHQPVELAALRVRHCAGNTGPMHQAVRALAAERGAHGARGAHAHRVVFTHPLELVEARFMAGAGRRLRLEGSCIHVKAPGRSRRVARCSVTGTPAANGWHVLHPWQQYRKITFAPKSGGAEKRVGGK